MAKIFVGEDFKTNIPPPPLTNMKQFRSEETVLPVNLFEWGGGIPLTTLITFLTAHH